MSIKEIQYERDLQHAKWGNAADDKWSLGEWAALISHYATRHTVGDLHAVDVATFRADLVKVGALAVAAIEAIERKAP